MDYVALARQALEPVPARHDALYDILADDVVMYYATDSAPLAPPCVGKESVMRFYEETSPSLADGTGLDSRLEYFGRGNTVVVIAKERYRIRRSGVTVEGRWFAVIMRFRGDKLAEYVHIKDLTEFSLAYTD